MAFGVFHPSNAIIFSFLFIKNEKMQVTAEDDEISMIQRGAAEVEKITGTNLISFQISSNYCIINSLKALMNYFPSDAARSMNTNNFWNFADSESVFHE